VKWKFSIETLRDDIREEDLYEDLEENSRRCLKSGKDMERSWSLNIDVGVIVWSGMDKIVLAQNMDERRALVNALMIPPPPGFHKIPRIS
jgi:hypothetical protein